MRLHAHDPDKNFLLVGLTDIKRRDRRKNDEATRSRHQTVST